MGISTSSRPRVGYWLNCEFPVLVNLMNAIEVLDQSWGVNSSSATFRVWFELEFPVTMTASRVIWILLFIDEVMIPNPWSAVGGHLPSTIWRGGPSHHPHLCLTLTCQSNRVRVSTTFKLAMGHRQKKKLPSSVLLLLWPGEVRRKREGDSGQTGPALFAGSNKTELGNFFFCRCPIIRIRYLIDRFGD